MPHYGIKIWICTLLIALCTIGLYGQTPLQVQYLQCDAPAQNIILSARIPSLCRHTAQADQHLHKLISRLHQQNYIAANIDSMWLQHDTIKAIIYVGPCMHILHTRILCPQCNNNDYPSFKADKYLQNIHNINELQAYANHILTYLENHGYPFAKVQIDHLLPATQGMGATLLVEKNNYIVLDSLVQQGNHKLRPSFLYGYLGLKRKKAYNASLINKVNDKLQNLNYLQLTRDPGVAFSHDKAALYIFADKKKINQFEGYLGLVPSDEISGKILVTGNLNLDLNNIFSIGEHLSLSWKRTQVQSQTLDIALNFPYLFYTSLGIDASFNMEKKDTQYVNLYAEIGLQYYLIHNGCIKAYYAYQNSRLIYNASLATLTSLPAAADYNLHWYGLSFQTQKLDYLYNPRKGYNINVNVAAGNKTLLTNAKIPAELYNGINKKTAQFKASVHSDFYFPMGKHFTWLLSCRAAHIQASNLYQNELFEIGGLQSLRGFDHHSLQASTYVILSNEIRFLFAKQSYIQAFFDIAGYEKKCNNTYYSDFPFGFGMGIAFNTKAGIFSLSYALGRQKGNPVKFATGKINFGYTALF